MTTEFINLKKSLSKIKNRNKVKILLHVGTPKTGTTSIQHFLYKNKKQLYKNGYLYECLENNEEKHQWMIMALLNEDFVFFTNKLIDYFKSADENIHTLILSSEGIFNHWYDFSSKSKKFLKMLAEVFKIEVYCWLRDQVSYVKSYYQQVLRNPQMPLVQCYGKDILVDGLLADKWFLRHLKYYDFLSDCSAIFGHENIRVFKYSNEMIREFIDSLDIEMSYEKEIRENSSLNAASCELLRIINRQNLSTIDKDIVLNHLYSINTIIDKYDIETLMNKKTINKISDFVKEENKLLEKEYKISLELK